MTNLGIQRSRWSNSGCYAICESNENLIGLSDINRYDGTTNSGPELVFGNINLQTTDWSWTEIDTPSVDDPTIEIRIHHLDESTFTAGSKIDTLSVSCSNYLDSHGIAFGHNSRGDYPRTPFALIGIL
jgi:hypothetical protein